MKKKVLIVLGMCALTLTGCGKTVPKLENGKEVVASIDGYDLTAEDLYEELKIQNGISVAINKIDTAIADKEIGESKEAKDAAENQIKALKAQCEMYGLKFTDVLSQYYGYDNEEDLRKDMIIDYKKNLALKKYLAEQLTDDEINKYYDSEIYGEMAAKHILITPITKDGMTDDEKKAAEEEAKKKAEDLIEQIKNGADFETLAKENSNDGSASQGGLITNITKSNTVKEFFDATLALKDGEYTTSPVKTIYGYHIILRVSQQEKPALSDVIDDVKDSIVENKLTDDKNLSVTGWDGLRKKHNLSINDSIIEKKYNSVIDSYKENA